MKMDMEVCVVNKDGFELQPTMDFSTNLQIAVLRYVQYFYNDVKIENNAVYATLCYYYGESVTLYVTVYDDHNRAVQSDIDVDMGEYDGEVGEDEVARELYLHILKDFCGDDSVMATKLMTDVSLLAKIFGREKIEGGEL